MSVPSFLAPWPNPDPNAIREVRKWFWLEIQLKDAFKKIVEIAPPYLVLL